MKKNLMSFRGSGGIGRFSVCFQFQKELKVSALKGNNADWTENSVRMQMVNPQWFLGLSGCPHRLEHLVKLIFRLTYGVSDSAGFGGALKFAKKKMLERSFKDTDT